MCELCTLKEMDREIVEFLVEHGQLPAFKQENDPIDDLSEALYNRLRRMQVGLESRFIQVLRELGFIPGDPEQQRKLIEEIMGETFLDMEDVIVGACIEGATIGRKITFADIIRQGLRVVWYDFNPYVVEELETRFYRFCEDTFSRIKGDFATTLSEGYKDGVGIDDIARRLREDFAGLRDWQLERIARTEVNSAGSMGAQQTLIDYGIQYKQWISTQDNRTRGNRPRDKADHVSMHGQVVKIDEPFSNGLMYPGDRNGPLEEFINCRCRHRAYIPRRGEIITNTPYYPPNYPPRRK